MSYEVEQKYRVEDFLAVEQRLVQLGATPGLGVEQRDVYFSHPQRDFGSTDEALRIRRVEDSNLITYKGPKLDLHSKTRREIEIGFASGAAAWERMQELLSSLGFRCVAEVRKTRRSAVIHSEQSAVEVTFDDVDMLGTFVEIETLALDSDLDVAREHIQAVAEKLGLSRPERRSYLELLLNLSPTGAGEDSLG